MRKLVTALFALGAIAAVPASAVTTISFSGGTGLPPGANVFQDFEGFAAGSSIGTNAFVYSGSSTNGAKPAFGSSGNYASVLAGGTYSVSFAPMSGFAFVLGSLDNYNALTLNYADGSSFTYNGGAIIGGLPFADGSTSSPSANGTVTYRVTSGPLLTGAIFQSSINSFEFDNLTAVPEPAAWAMMIGGFGLIGGAMRRRKAQVRRVAFA